MPELPGFVEHDQVQRPPLVLFKTVHHGSAACPMRVHFPVCDWFLFDEIGAFVVESLVLVHEVLVDVLLVFEDFGVEFVEGFAGGSDEVADFAFERKFIGGGKETPLLE